MRPSEGPEQMTIGVAITVFGCGPNLADAMVSVQPQSPIALVAEPTKLFGAPPVYRFCTNGLRLLRTKRFVRLQFL
jgi:hypothetical protein